MTEPEWLLKLVILAVHTMAISEFGGAEGLRDEVSATTMTTALAVSEIDETAYAAWLLATSERLRRPR